MHLHDGWWEPSAVEALEAGLSHLQLDIAHSYSADTTKHRWLVAGKPGKGFMTLMAHSDSDWA